ncbi:MAG TPA: PRC-barrel domain-containing protein [Clostridia bacterium]|nr:PRC-barrel domain-containing protein [Clostridia bacterium]
MGKSINRGAILGLPIICESTGKKMGIVLDILFEAQDTKIQGILGSGIGYWATDLFVPFDKIKAFGKVAIIVGGDSVRGIPTRKSNHLVGRTIISDDGQELGEIRNVIFNSEDGEIEGFEISRGLVDDLLGGRNILPSNYIPHTDGDVIVIPTEQSMDIKSNNRGIINILSNLKP